MFLQPWEIHFHNWGETGSDAVAHEDAVPTHAAGCSVHQSAGPASTLRLWLTLCTPACLLTITKSSSLKASALSRLKLVSLRCPSASPLIVKTDYLNTPVFFESSPIPAIPLDTPLHLQPWEGSAHKLCLVSGQPDKMLYSFACNQPTGSCSSHGTQTQTCCTHTFGLEGGLAQREEKPHWRLQLESQSLCYQAPTAPGVEHS